MIAPKVTSIEIRTGVKVNLLLTPALYGIAKERGIDLFGPVHNAAEQDDQERYKATVEAYARIAYCAAISYWEVDCVDHPEAGAFPYTFADFYSWAWDNPRDFAQAIEAIMVAMTGKPLREYLKELDKAAEEDEKKKTRATGFLRRLLPSIGRPRRPS